VETLRLRLMETVKAEQKNLSTEIIRRTRTEVFAIVRKTLSDLASVDLEEQMASVFIIRINELNPDERESLDSTLKKSSKEILVRSTFGLPEKQQSAIQNAIKTNFNITTGINFETAPHLVSGIELITNGYKISWTIEDYLISLENHIKELLDERSVVKSENLP
jgi:F-type H+-transporting ATPase subunit b